MIEQIRNSDQSRETTYYSHSLVYPSELIEERVDPVPVALDALKLGILADRGKVLQRVGNIYLRLRVADIPPFIPTGKPEESTVSIFNVTSDTVRFISTQTRLKPISALGIQDWYLRVLEMHQRFDNDETRLVLDTPSGRFLATRDAMDQAWDELGYPQPYIIDIDPYRVVTPYARVHIPFQPDRNPVTVKTVV